jgi:hypothetical protein
MVAFVILLFLWMSVGGNYSLLALIITAIAFGSAYIPSIPVAFRFFPISAITGIAGSMVVLLGGI